jgi:hypothetical protein
MPTYPIEANDSEAIASGLNYVLSGPSGLGQNFQGFSAYSAAPFPGPATTTFLTGNYRPPFTQPSIALLYVPFIDFNLGEMLDGQTYKFTFVSAQASPPYALGQPIEVTDSPDSEYNQRYVIGVVECTTTYVILRSETVQPIIANTTSGTLNWFNTGATRDGLPLYSGTDCNAKVTVFGASDRVFVAAQLNNVISYTTDASTYDFYYFVNINRYIGSPNNDPTNPEFVFSFDKTVSQSYYNFPTLTGTGSLSNIESIFTTVIDEPDPGYYWYILEVWTGTPDEGLCNVTSMELGLRSLSAQVVKE